MGLLFLESLPGPKIYKCGRCKAHSASHDAIMSKDFHGSYGPAYLFKSVDGGGHARASTIIRVVDVDGGSDLIAPTEITWQIAVGALAGVTPFIVAGIEFSKRIEKAYEENQKYKEGKYILEITRTVKEGW